MLRQLPLPPYARGGNTQIKSAPGIRRDRPSFVFLQLSSSCLLIGTECASLSSPSMLLLLPYWLWTLRLSLRVLRHVLRPTERTPVAFSTCSHSLCLISSQGFCLKRYLHRSTDDACLCSNEFDEAVGPCLTDTCSAEELVDVNIAEGIACDGLWSQLNSASETDSVSETGVASEPEGAAPTVHQQNRFLFQVVPSSSK